MSRAAPLPACLAHARRTPPRHGLAQALVVCGAAYLYGSLPFVYLLGRQAKVDLRRTGSGNVGGSNLWAAGGAARGAAGWLGDASKGLLPVAACRLLGGADEVAALAGVCGVVGQCWPVFLRFDGGRGISAFVGAAFMIDRAAWAAALVPLAGGSLWRVAMLPRRGPAAPSAAARLRTTRSMSVPLGCLLGMAVFPLVGRRSRGRMAPGHALLSLVVVLRRLTAPLPDDAACGPAVRPQALLFRLLFDRNTSR